jgi:hypothetical protein
MDQVSADAREQIATVGVVSDQVAIVGDGERGGCVDLEKSMELLGGDRESERQARRANAIETKRRR